MNVIELDDYRLIWTNTKMECFCGRKWIATHPFNCLELQCPGCRGMVPLDPERIQELHTLASTIPRSPK